MDRAVSRPDHMDSDPGSPWRTIEAGIRSGGPWMDAFYAFRRSPAMSDSDVLAMVHSLLDHGRYLRRFNTKLNWLTMEMSGLYAVGAVFPEFKESSEWRTYAAATLADAGRNQFLPDGGQVGTLEHISACSYGQHFADRRNRPIDGNVGDLPADYLARLKKPMNGRWTLPHLTGICRGLTIWAHLPPRHFRRQLSTFRTIVHFNGLRATGGPVGRLHLHLLF